MIMDVKRKILKNEKGQALVEFLLFLPFMLIMYSITLSISNSINASINQQKVTRNYFYYLHQNTSHMPRASRGGSSPVGTWNVFGMSIIGWMEDIVGNQPMATCFKFRVPLGETDDDACEDGYDKTTTQFIRVGTVYGVCGTTYRRNNTSIYNRILDSPVLVTSQDACHITQ